jgi:hypothetical protein
MVVGLGFLGPELLRNSLFVENFLESPALLGSGASSGVGSG